MKDISCPYCGLPNLPDADVCRYCSKPLNFSEKSRSGESDAQDYSDGLSDWLQNIRSKMLDEDSVNEDQVLSSHASSGSASEERSEENKNPDEIIELIKPGISRAPRVSSDPPADDAEGEDVNYIIFDKQAEDKIKTGQLGRWLRVKPSHDDSLHKEKDTAREKEQAEWAGPLAGLVGALPAEPDLSQPLSPSFLSSRLNISEEQQRQAKLIEKSIEAEGEAKELPKEQFLRARSTVRIMTALLLFFIVAFAYLNGLKSWNQPEISPEVIGASALISNLSAGSSVLVVVDYAPSFSSEIEAILAVLAEHIISRGGYLVFVTSLPTGSVQSEILISKITARLGLRRALDHANLGFLPGGALGILAFSQAPERVLPLDIHNKDLWNSSHLKDIHQLSDFGLVIIATENADTSRVWIEQAQPLLADAPMIMVVSAQNAPIVRSYYGTSSRQVQGLLGGLSAAVEYETLIGRPSETTRRWAVYSASHFASVGIILIGLLGYLLAGAVYRTRQKLNPKGQL